jgi:hypothetical protein
MDLDDYRCTKCGGKSESCFCEPDNVTPKLEESQTTGAQQLNYAIALAEKYCDSCLSHSAEERMTMFRFTMWVREQQHN